MPELHAELEVAVGVGECGEGDVRVAAELGRRDELVVGAPLAELAVRAEAPLPHDCSVVLLSRPLHEALALRAALQVAKRVDLVHLVAVLKVVRRGRLFNVGQGERRLHLRK